MAYKLKQPAFTLIELLVAMVVTALMLTLVMASYWTFLKTSNKMAVSRELQSEVRFALNRIADKVRSTNPDYSQYQAGSPCGTSNASTGGFELCLITPDQSKTHLFEYDDTALSLTMDGQPLISPQKFMVNMVNFNLSPQQDPKVITNPQVQPKVTVFISASPTDSRYQDLVIETQTTISSRQY